MGINITPKNDMSFLFSNMPSTGGNSSSVDLSWLSDYSAIKNGSYGKLMKAYYGMNSNSSVNKIVSDKKSTDSATELATVTSAADSLKDSADKLLDTKPDSESVYDSANSFVKQYNSLLKSTEGVSNETVNRRTTNLINATASNATLLGKAGITINTDNSLSIDKEKFQAADQSLIKSLFNGTGSYAYNVSTQASLIGYASEHASQSGYTANGTYASNQSGALFSSYF